jgi:hypothetical protein
LVNSCYSPLKKREGGTGESKTTEETMRYNANALIRCTESEWNEVKATLTPAQWSLLYSAWRQWGYCNGKGYSPKTIGALIKKGLAIKHGSSQITLTDEGDAFADKVFAWDRRKFNT